MEGGERDGDGDGDDRDLLSVFSLFRPQPVAGAVHIEARSSSLPVQLYCLLETPSKIFQK